MNLRVLLVRGGRSMQRPRSVAAAAAAARARGR
eukprot:COSAG01_NODE_3186_length_6441_cov_145.702460_1_plen_33_part_00